MFLGYTDKWLTWDKDGCFGTLCFSVISKSASDQWYSKDNVFIVYSNYLVGTTCLFVDNHRALVHHTMLDHLNGKPSLGTPTPDCLAAWDGSSCFCSLLWHQESVFTPANESLLCSAFPQRQEPDRSRERWFFPANKRKTFLCTFLLTISQLRTVSSAAGFVVRLMRKDFAVSIQGQVEREIQAGSNISVFILWCYTSKKYVNSVLYSGWLCINHRASVISMFCMYLCG